MALNLTSAQQREIAADAEFAANQISLKPSLSDADKKSLRQLNGREIAALARASHADAQHPRFIGRRNWRSSIPATRVQTG